MKQLLAGLLLGILVAALGVLLGALPGLGPVLGLAAGFAAPILAAAVTWAGLPRLAKVAATAEERNGVTLLLYTHDDRLLPIAAQYDPERHMIRPTGRLRNKLIVFPDPGSTISLYGHRQKLALVHIDQPVAISPEYLAIVYDLRYRYQAENLGVALDLDRAARKGIEELERDAEKTRQLLALAEKALAGDREAAGELAKQLGREEELDDHELAQVHELLRRRLDMVETALRLARKRGRPVAFIGARVYTVKDLMGYLGFRVRNTSLRTIKELARLEAMERLGRRWAEYMPFITVIFLAVVALAIVAIIFGGHGASLPHPQLPTKVINVTGAGP